LHFDGGGEPLTLSTGYESRNYGEMNSLPVAEKKITRFPHECTWGMTFS
jgi:hypothetical protein